MPRRHVTTVIQSLAKGAPEVILAHCDRQQTGTGTPAPLRRERFMAMADRLAGQGERVLALAWSQQPGVGAGSLGPADLPKDLILLGLVDLLDPPRQEAIEAVHACHEGGIRVTMITGDHKINAAAIAKMLGIGAVVLPQGLFTYAAPPQVLFDTEAIPLRVWPWLFLGGLVFFLVVEVEKLVIRLVPPLRRAVTSVEAGSAATRAAEV